MFKKLTDKLVDKITDEVWSNSSWGGTNISRNEFEQAMERFMKHRNLKKLQQELKTIEKNKGE